MTLTIQKQLNSEFLHFLGGEGIKTAIAYCQPPMTLQGVIQSSFLFPSLVLYNVAKAYHSNAVVYVR